MSETDRPTSPLPTRRQFLEAAAGLTIVSLANGAVPLVAARDAAAAAAAPVDKDFPTPAWVYSVTRMAFGTPGEVEPAARAGAQVFHTNLVWPYYPLKKEGGGLSADDDHNMRKLADDCHKAGMKLSLGLPPFPPVNLVKAHPDWRIHPDDTGSVLKIEPREDNLGTRNPCNVGPWGDYLIEVCAELVRDYGVDGYSFDGNYHPPICYCPACKAAYKTEKGRDLPPAANLDEVAYREYLVWRGEKLTDHYVRLRRRLRKENPDAALMSWTVNAGRYGHFLHSPRAMPTSINRVFDLPMQEWWLDETNFGASVAPAFGAAYLRATTGGNPAASEAYLMSRGNPYGTDSFPAHERIVRNLLAVANGCITAEAFGWPGHLESTKDVMAAVGERTPWMTGTTPWPWAAMLVSEQTRQFYAYRDIAERFLPHVFGAFRVALEEHLPLALVNDWDLTPAELAKYAVLVLPNAAALSDAQVSAVRQYVESGGGLVATGETSLCDEIGRPRNDFALAELFGAKYQGRPKAPLVRPELDVNFAITVDEKYWRERTGVARLAWQDHPLFDDEALRRLVPGKSVTFRGPQVAVSEPGAATEVVARMTPEGWQQPPLPAIIARSFGRGRVVYLAAAIDAALWSYSYPYQRRLLARAVEWAAREPAPVLVNAPRCVQTTWFTRSDDDGGQLVMHLFNGVNTTANHGLPATDVPLREETLPVHGIKVRFRHAGGLISFHCEPGHLPVNVTREGDAAVVELPPLEIHSMLVARARQ